jgi:hypothetical protein
MAGETPLVSPAALPVLLYAAQKGAPLTPRMKGMLEEVHRRALSLACCFHGAARLARAPRAAARRRWGAMERLPVEIIHSIATMAAISVVAVEYVK